MSHKNSLTNSLTHSLSHLPFRLHISSASCLSQTTRNYLHLSSQPVLSSLPVLSSNLGAPSVTPVHPYLNCSTRETTLHTASTTPLSKSQATHVHYPSLFTYDVIHWCSLSSCPFYCIHTAPPVHSPAACTHSKVIVIVTMLVLHHASRSSPSIMKCNVNVLFIYFIITQINQINVTDGAYIFGYLLHNPIPDEAITLFSPPMVSDQGTGNCTHSPVDTVSSSPASPSTASVERVAALVDASSSYPSSWSSSSSASPSASALPLVESQSVAEASSAHQVTSSLLVDSSVTRDTLTTRKEKKKRKKKERKSKDKSTTRRPLSA